MNSKDYNSDVNKIKKSIQDIDSKISNYVPFNSVSKNIISEISEYISDITPLIGKIIVLSKGLLVIEDDKVYYKKDKKSAFEFNYDNAMSVLEDAASNINSLFATIIKKGADEKDIAKLGKYLVTIYNIYENIKSLENEAKSNFVSLADLKEKKRKLENSLSDIESQYKDRAGNYAAFKNTVLLHDINVKEEITEDLKIDIAYNDKNFEVLSWHPLKEILHLKEVSLDDSIPFVKSLTMQFFFAVNDVNCQLGYCSAEANNELMDFFIEVNKSFNDELFYSGMNPDGILKNRYFIQDSFKNLFEIIDARKKLLNSDARYNNIIEYNLKNPNDQQKYILFFVQQYPIGFEEIGNNLKFFFQSAAELGIFIVAIEKIKNVTDKDRYCDTVSLDNFNLLSLRMKDNVLIDNNDTNFSFPLLEPNEISKLLKICNKTILAKNRPVTFEDIGFGLKSEKTSEVKGSLYIPIGKVDNKIFSINFASDGSEDDGIIGGIVTGGSGSGKSSLINSLIYNGAMKYSPDDLNFYLIDFKDGVSNSAFLKQAQIPHVKLLTGKSKKEDVEIILSLLLKEKVRRNSIFKAEGVTDIASYNANHKEKHMPRIIAIIDEANVMLDDDVNSSNSSTMNDKIISYLSYLTAQGRSAGIHILMAAQKFNSGLRSASQLFNGKFCFTNPKDDVISDTLVFQNAVDVVHNEVGVKKGVCVFTIGGDAKNSYSVVKCAFIGNPKYKDNEKYSALIREKWSKYKITTKLIANDDIVSFKEYSQKQGIYKEKDLGAAIGLDYSDSSIVHVPFDKVCTSLAIVGTDFDNYEPNTEILTSIFVYALRRKAKILAIDETESQKLKDMFGGNPSVKFFSRNEYFDALIEFKKIYDYRFDSRADGEPVFLIVSNLNKIKAFTENQSSASDNVESNSGYMSLAERNNRNRNAIRGADAFIDLLKGIKNVKNMFMVSSTNLVSGSVPDNYIREYANVSTKIINSPFPVEVFSEDINSNVLKTCSKKLSVMKTNGNNYGDLDDGEGIKNPITKVRFFRYDLDRETFEAIKKEIKR